MGDKNGNNTRRKNKSTIEHYQKTAQKNPRMPQNFQEDMDPPEEPSFPLV
jgi:hypothetical protein